MNKNCYRVIFSRAKSQLVVVAENVAGQGKTHSQATGVSSNSVPMVSTLKRLNFSLWLAMGWVLSGQSVLADIVADPNAPGNQQATVLNAGNGVPLVNIQTPSAGGVSRNIYSQFDVQQQGAILNNSRTDVQTQLGGYVQGNPWLATGSAKVILNEVNSSNPSQLQGYVEVAGSRAEVVIANPSGISCNGCGFINANRSTLTTGRTQLNGGIIEAYQVERGEISVDGSGLDSSQSDYTDLIARSVKVNAALHANQLKVSTGPHQTDAAHDKMTATQPTSQTPTIAIDVAQLGGMYANKITLIGTEAGVGVRNAGQIGASAGDVVISNHGTLENIGQINASQNLNLNTQGDLNNTSIAYAQANTQIYSAAILSNSGTIAAQQNTVISANHIQSSGALAAGINQQGTLVNATNLQLNANETLIASGQNLATEQTLTAKQIDLSHSETTATNLTVTASQAAINFDNAKVIASQKLIANTQTTLSNHQGQVATNQLVLTAHDLDNSGGELIQTGTQNLSLNLAGQINNQQGKIASNSDNLTLNAQQINNLDGKLQHAGSGQFGIQTAQLDSSGGQIQSNNRLDMNVGQAILDRVSLSAVAVNIKANQLSNRSGAIVQSGHGLNQIQVRDQLDNTAGIIASNGSSQIKTAALLNQAGQLKIANGGDLTLDVLGLLDNSQNGRIQVTANSQINAVDVDNHQGQFSAGNRLTLNSQQDLNNNQGLIAADQGLTLNVNKAIDNRNGAIQSAIGSLSMTSGSDLDNRAGQLLAKQTISVQSQNLDNSDGQIGSQTINLATQNQLINNGQGLVAAQGTMAIHSGSLTNQGKLQAQSDLNLNIDQSLTNSGTIYSQTNTQIDTGSDFNNSGLIAAQINNRLSISTTLNNTQSGVLAAGFNADGSLATLGDLTIRALNDITNHGISLAAGSLNQQGNRLWLNGFQANATDINLIADSGNIDLKQAMLNASGQLSIKTLQTLITDNAKLSANRLSFNAHDLSNRKGQMIQTGVSDWGINLLGVLNNEQGLIASNSNAFTLIADQLINSNGQIQHAGIGQLTLQVNQLNGNSGQIQSNGQLLASIGDAELDNAQTIAKQLIFTANQLSHRHGQLIQIGSGTSQIQILQSLNNQGGLIQAANTGNLSVTIGDLLDNSAQGKLQADGYSQIQVGSLKNQQGTVTATQGLRLDSQQAIDNQNGLIAANQAVVINSAGIDNRKGNIASAKSSLSLNSGTAAINNSAGGKLAALGDVSVVSLGLNNAAGSLLGQNLLIDTQQQSLNNQVGQLIASANLSIASGEVLNQSGLVQAAVNLNLDSHGQQLDNRDSGSQAGLLAGGTLTLNIGSLNNQHGYVGSQGDLNATASGLLDNQAAGQLLSQSQFSLTAKQLDNRGGQVQAQGNLTANLSDWLNNEASLMRAGQTLSLTANRIDNQNTQGKDQGLEAQTVSLSAEQIQNQQGAIRANQGLSIRSSGQLDNSAGLISALINLSINDLNAQANSNVANKTLAITNSNGTLIAGEQLSFDVASLSGDGQVLSQKDLSIKLSQDYTHNSNAQIQANSNARLETLGTLRNQDTLQAGNSFTLIANAIDNSYQSQILSDRLKLQSASTLDNRGLINTIDTYIDAMILNNLGTGRIYGDHLAIQADTVNNLNETVDGNTQAAVIAARERLDIGANTINNREHAMLFSLGDIVVGGQLDNQYHAINQAHVLNNNSATIEAMNNLVLSAGEINNTNQHLETQQVQILSEDRHEYQGQQFFYGHYADPNPQRYQANEVSFVSDTLSQGLTRLLRPNTATSTSQDYMNYYEYQFTRTVTETQVTKTDPGQILSGAAMRISGSTLRNLDSQIIAGGDLDTQLATLNNQASVGDQITTDIGRQDYWQSFEPYGKNNDYTIVTASSDYKPAPVDKTIVLDTVRIESNTAPVGTHTQITALSNDSLNQSASGANATNINLQTANNGGTIANVSSLTGNSYNGLNQAQGNQTHLIAPQILQVPTNTINPSNQLTAADKQNTSVIRTLTLNDQLPNNSLFNVNPNPVSRYLVETDNQFTHYKQWLSSDYLLSKLAIDPNVTQKRMGDGFYEQKLVREQIAQLTGQRFLNGYSNDETEYRALMDNGLTFAQSHQLIPGVALSAAQMAQLTSDIVWLVAEDVTLADGSVQSVLVPHVYAKLNASDIDGNGAVLSGNSLNLNLSADLNNSGTLAGRQVTRINADTVNNLGGRITGNQVEVTAKTDLNNIGGQISANNQLAIEAGRDIKLASTTRTSSNDQSSNTVLDRIAGLYVKGANGILSAKAGNDINLMAAQINNNGINGQSQLLAGRDLLIGTVGTSSQNRVANNNGFWSESSRLENTTSIFSDGNLNLFAKRDLTLQGATLNNTHGDLLLNAGRELQLDVAQNSRQYAQSQLGNGISVSSRVDAVNNRSTQLNSAGHIGLQSGDNLNLISAQLNAGQDLTLIAGHNLNLSVAKDTQDYASSSRIKPRSDVLQSQDESVIANNLNANGNIRLAAQGTDGNINILASNITSSDGRLSLAATQDINLETANEQHQSIEQRSQKRSSLLSSSQKTTITESQSSLAVGNNLSANTVEVLAGHNLAIIGSSVVADQAVNLLAGNDINLVAANNHSDQTTIVNSKKSGFLGGTGGAGFTLGSQTSKTTTHTVQDQAVASTIGSLQGDVTIHAGHNYQQIGSDVLATQGNVDILARQVDITAAENRSQTTIDQKTRQSGITFSMSNPLVHAAETSANMLQAAGNTDSTRMKALAAASSGLSFYNAYQAVQASPKTLGGIDASISFGSSQTQSHSEQTQSNALGSQVLAGKDLSIVATGNGQANSGNLSVIGAELSAGHNLDLTAANDLLLQAATNQNRYSSSQKSSSSSIGFSSGTSNLFAITASASEGKGKANSEDIYYSNTHVNAGNQVNLNSGQDTIIKGAVVSGQQIVANVGTSGQGNLNIDSLQDQSHYNSQQQSLGGSVSVGLSNGGASLQYSKSNINSHYLSVTEQSGFKAGNGGFQIEVNGNTDLIGGLIASNSTAVDLGLNQLITETLTSRDLQNQAKYKANSLSISAGVGLNTGPTGLLQNSPSGMAGYGSDSGKANSTTFSAVSVGDLQITNAAAQHAKTGQSAEQTVAGLNRDTANAENAIKPIFDQQKVENEINAQVQITQVFGQQASKLIGDYANEKYQAAVQANDKDAMDSWGEGGSSRIALHSVIAGLSGYYGAAVGTAVSQALVPHLGELLILASLDPIVKQVLIEAAGFAIGSVAGNSGAVAAFNATTNNYLMHNRLVDEEGELLKLRENQAKGNCDSVCKSRIEELENLDKQRDIAIQPYIDDCQKAGRSNCRGEAVARRYADTNGFGDLAMAKESNPGSLGSPFSFNNCPSSDKGGCSYGPLQIAANNGMVENFLTDLKNNPSDEAQYFYKRLMAVGGSQASKTNDPNFVNVWMELTAKDPQFVQYQMDTLINRNLYPALLELRKVGVDWNNLSREEKNMLFSAAVQHGAGVQSKAKGLDNILERTFSNSEITPPTQHTYTREDQIYDEVEFQLQQAEKEIQKFDKKIQQVDKEKVEILMQKDDLKTILLQQKTSNVNQQLLDTIDSKIQALDAQINGLTSKANTLTEQKNEQYRYIDDAKRYLVESARNTVGDEEGFIKRFYQERKEMYPQEAKRYDDEINQLLKALHSRSK